MAWKRRLTRTSRPSLILGGSGTLEHLRDESASLRGKGSRLFLLTDENVRSAWGDVVLDHLGASVAPEDVRVVSPGEPSKSVTVLAACWDWLADRGARRNDVLVALGGGVVGDLAGFLAATYLRGIRLWQVPTSLLAQVDSSVGGKNGVNLEAGKNLVGTFFQPELVVVDTETLSTLPADEYVGGLGEVVKYGLLAGAGMFSLLEESVGAVADRDPTILSTLVEKCVRYKADVVEEDELDQGRRAVLNLGHTTGHALEKTLGYGGISHGKAVALGLLVALAVSERLTGLGAEVGTRARMLLSALGLPTTIELPPVEDMLAAASRDKKMVQDRTLFVCLEELGKPVWGVDVSPDEFSSALEVIRS